MTPLAPTLQAFFTDRLLTQRRASPQTVAAYRDAFRLLLGYVQRQSGTAPSDLEIQDLDASLIGAFLDHLEHDRGNTARTRNARLAAIHSFFRFAAIQHPEHAAIIERVLAIPAKRFRRTGVSFLTREEIDALVEAPDRSHWIGRRDHALLVTAIQTGLRLSELTGLSRRDARLGRGPHVSCSGKGRKDRCTPLTTQSVAILKSWLRERDGDPAEPLFPTRHGKRLSSDAVELLVAKYASVAEAHCATLRTKTVTPHVLRHSAAMNLLQAGVDSTVIALWLGHESVQTTQVYIHADLSLKERALARTAPIGTVPGRYRPGDSLLAFLEGL
jgi:site-specific recombinase XerD